MCDSKGNKVPKRFKLDSVEKKNIYQVPDTYFEKLPGIVQSRVERKPSFFETSYFRIGIRYALPVACLLLIGIYFGYFGARYQQPQDFEALLAEVSYEDLVAYLENSDISTEEIITSIEDQDLFVEFEIREVDPLQDFQFENENIDELMEEFDIDGTYF